MVHGTDDGPTGTEPTYTPAITVTNTSNSALNLQDYLGGAVTYDIWFLNSDGNVVYYDQEDVDMGWPSSFHGTLGPGDRVTYTAYYNSNIGLGVPAQEDMDQQPDGNSVTQCKAMFVDGYGD